MQLLNPRAIRGGTHPQVLATDVDGDAAWVNLADLTGDVDDGLALDDLSDVTITGVAHGETIRWNSVSGRWENDTNGAGAIDDLTDVDTTTAPPSLGDTLTWDGLNWVPGAGPATGALVPLTTVVAGVPQLVWDADNQLVLTEVPL